MARPSYGYHNAAGRRVPGSTTICGLINFFGNSDALCGWAAKLAREGKDWRKERDTAGKRGTMLHELCEKFLPGEPQRPDGISDEWWNDALASYRVIARWWTEQEMEPVLAEEPLVSEAFQFGGTLDGLARWKKRGGGLWLYDFKTGAHIGAKEVVQMASYRQLLDECRQQRPEGAVLLHAPTKEPGYMRPIVCTAQDLDRAWEVFKYGLAVNALLPALKEVAE